jgi:glycosyltransferase involved in cell wall biosynthesis
VKILLVHAYYRQPGGEEEVFRAERELLEQRGHDVVTFTMSNEQMASMGRLAQARATIWNGDAAAELREVVRTERPALAHFHNTFPLLSPAVLRAAHAERVPVVQTLHNYRLICSNGLFLREGRNCEKCLGRSLPWPAVVHRCYRDSVAASGVVATMLTTHRLARTWVDHVDRFIVPTEFAKGKLLEAGLAADRLSVKPNFVPDPALPVYPREDFALFVGRLSEEKGIGTLLAAWKDLPSVPLTIVGDGPLRGWVEDRAREMGGGARINVLGRREPDEVRTLMQRARLLVFPSESYEGGPRVVLEAFAAGLPVVASRLGSMTELIEDGRTGLHFTARDSSDLAAKIRHAISGAPLARMGRDARQEYESRYTPDRNYELLRAIYDLAIGAHDSVG